MTGDDRAGCVDQDRIDKSEAFDRSRDLLDLALRMRARVMLISSKCLQISQFRSGERNHGPDLLTLAPRAARVKGSVHDVGSLALLPPEWLAHLGAR